MSKLTEKEAELCDSIKVQFEAEGVLDEIRCQLQSRLVAMMRGGGTVHTEQQNAKPDARTELLNQLIMEYLHWQQFNYSAEMFATETGATNASPNRDLLEAALGGFRMKELPILLEIVLDLWRKEQGDSNEV